MVLFCCNIIKLCITSEKILKDNIGKNVAVSSFAFRLPFCKLAAIAAPDTRHEIISALDIETISDTKKCYASLFPALAHLLETDLTTLNKIYVNYTDAINDSFILGAAKFGLTVSKIGFDYPRDAVAYVNREFSTKTYMRISDVLDENDIDTFSSILLVNGIHYKGTWEVPLSSLSSQTQIFRSGEKTVHIEMMQAITQCSFLDDKKGKYKAISFHLSQQGTYLTLILPHQKTSIVDLLNRMSANPNFLDDIDKRVQWKFVNMLIPKFKIKAVTDWTPFLTQIGLNLTTSRLNKGLNTILKDGEHTKTNMYVSKAKQKIFVELDEGRKPNEYIGNIDTPMVRPEIARNGPDFPDTSLEEFTVDGPFFFTIAVTTPPIRGDQKRVFRLMSGVYYGPQ